MKIGCIIIDSKYPERQKYVNNIEFFFKNTDVSVIKVDGIFTDDVLYDARFHDNRKLTKGQIGCALAHFNALKTAIDMDFDYVFIFEDDIDIYVKDYYELKNWLDNLTEYDICLVTNVGMWFEGIGHDGRIHKNTHVRDYMYTTCCFGTQCYYTNKNIIKLLYETQLNHLTNKKIHIADGLHIHCEKNKNEFLKIVTPQNRNQFFYLADINSIVDTFNS
jgi:GR25 family glycosyltransferase involved in LPS biosynthesis